jgi:hypothetical protein
MSRLFSDESPTPREQLVDAIARIIVATPGRGNTERAEAVLEAIANLGWVVIPFDKYCELSEGKR